MIAYSLFEGLTKLDAKTSLPEPDLADSWAVSPDGKCTRSTCAPRRGGAMATGHGGDFVYSFRRYSARLRALYSYMLWPIKNAEAFNEGKLTDFTQVGVKAIDNVTLNLPREPTRTCRPSPPTHVLPVQKRPSRSSVGWTRRGQNGRGRDLVGNGAFTLLDWNPSAHRGRENPLYWDAANTRLNRIEFYPIEKPDIEDLNFARGSCTPRISSRCEDPYYRSHVPPELGSIRAQHFYFFLNVTRPPFDNVKLRQALITASTRGESQGPSRMALYPPAHCLTAPNCGGYLQYAGTGQFREGQQLLAEAGYPGGKGFPQSRSSASRRRSSSG